jgi:hypothetical protein
MVAVRDSPLGRRGRPAISARPRSAIVSSISPKKLVFMDGRSIPSRARKTV